MNYEELTNNGKVVLVEFYATWCPHCRYMRPVVEEVKKRVEGHAEVSTLDIDQNRDEADMAGVRSVPTFLLYRNGRLVWRRSGELDEDTLVDKIMEETPVGLNSVKH